MGWSPPRICQEWIWNYQSRTTRPLFPSSPSRSRAVCSSPNPPPAPIYQGNKSKTTIFYKAAEQFRLEGRSSSLTSWSKLLRTTVLLSFKYLQGWWFLSFSGLLPQGCTTLMGIFGGERLHIIFCWNWIHFKSLILLKLVLLVLLMITRPWLGVTAFLLWHPDMRVPLFYLSDPSTKFES